MATLFTAEQRQMLEGALMEVMIHKGVRYRRLTPGKVTADLKKQTKYMASYYHPQLGKIRSGIKSEKINKYLVSVDYNLHKDIADVTELGSHWTDEFNRRWRAVLQGLLKAGYTLVALPLSDNRIVGGDAAYRAALQHGTVSVLMKE